MVPPLVLVDAHLPRYLFLLTTYSLTLVFCTAVRCWTKVVGLYLLKFSLHEHQLCNNMAFVNAFAIHISVPSIHTDCEWCMAASETDAIAHRRLS